MMNSLKNYTDISNPGANFLNTYLCNPRVILNKVLVRFSPFQNENNKVKNQFLKICLTYLVNIRTSALGFISFLVSVHSIQLRAESMQVTTSTCTKKRNYPSHSTKRQGFSLLNTKAAQL